MTKLTSPKMERRCMIKRRNADDALASARRAYKASKDPHALAALLQAELRSGFQNMDKQRHKQLGALVRAAYNTDMPELASLAKDIERTLRFTEPRWLKLKKTFGLPSKRAKMIDKLWKDFSQGGAAPGSAVMRYLADLLELEYDSAYPELPWLRFLDTGDPYENTLIFDARTYNHIVFGAWGDYMERYGPLDDNI